MPIYRSNTVEIEARQWNGSHISANEIISWILEEGGSATFLCGASCCSNELSIHVITSSGVMRTQPQDFIIKSTEGEFYPVDSSVFWKKYTEISQAH